MQHSSRNVATAFDLGRSGHDYVLARGQVPKFAPDRNRGSVLVGCLRDHDEKVDVAVAARSAPGPRPEQHDSLRRETTHDSLNCGIDGRVEDSVGLGRRVTHSNEP